jgi:hypothetical protein
MKKLIMAAALALLCLPAWAGELQPFARGSWQQLVEQHKGRRLVAHFWSLTCAPCLVEMKEWAALLKRQPDVDLVLIATDPIAEAPRIQQTLRANGLEGVESWAFADSFAERLRFEVDRRWRGEVPMTRIVLPDGSMETTLGTLTSGPMQHMLGH